MAKESAFQSSLKKELESRFDGCIVMKLDPTFRRGTPDLLVLYGDKWATLECKRDAKAHHQPLQDRRVAEMDQMSFSRFIYPENREEVINELEEVFRA